LKADYSHIPAAIVSPIESRVGRLALCSWCSGPLWKKSILTH